MKDQKFMIGDMTLSIVSKSSRALPAEARKALSEQSREGGASYDRALIVAFNPTGDDSYLPSIQRDGQKSAMFENLKASDRVRSRRLWLTEKKDSHTLTAYLVADHQSLMALTEAGVLGLNESQIRQDLTKIVEEAQHGR